MTTNENNGWSLDIPPVNPGAGLSPSASYNLNPTAQDLAFAAALETAAAQVVSTIANLQVVDQYGRASVEKTRQARILLGGIQPLVTQEDCTANGATFAYWQGSTNWQTALTQVKAQIAAGF